MRAARFPSSGGIGLANFKGNTFKIGNQTELPRLLEHVLFISIFCSPRRTRVPRTFLKDKNLKHLLYSWPFCSFVQGLYPRNSEPSPRSGHFSCPTTCLQVRGEGVWSTHNLKAAPSDGSRKLFANAFAGYVQQCLLWDLSTTLVSILIVHRPNLDGAGQPQGPRVAGSIPQQAQRRVFFSKYFF